MNVPKHALTLAIVTFLLCSASSVRAQPVSNEFDGLFDTEWGRVRLSQTGDNVTGTYSYGEGGTIEGSVVDGRLQFRYLDGSGAGEGWFELSPDGIDLNGMWRGDGSPSWGTWGGSRLVPDPDVVWLVILETHWETSIAENEYAFGDMLRSYFERLPNVHVRHRRMNDVADFRENVEQIAYLAEPVLLWLSGHGSEGRFILGGETLGAEEVIAAVNSAPNITLVHFAACDMMTGGIADQILAQIPPERNLAISGYGEVVDWGASAVLEILYLDLMLGWGLTPHAAASIVFDELNFADDSPTTGSPLGATDFQIAP